MNLNRNNQHDGHRTRRMESNNQNRNLEVCNHGFDIIILFVRLSSSCFMYKLDDSTKLWKVLVGMDFGQLTMTTVIH